MDDDGDACPQIPVAAGEDSCSCEGCTLNISRPAPFQPRDVAILSQFQRGKRNFSSSWYSTYKWVTLCTTKKYVFCAYCRYGVSQKMLTFSARCEPAFTQSGFDNFRKAAEKFSKHESSASHREAAMKSAQQGVSLPLRTGSFNKLVNNKKSPVPDC